MTDSLFYKDLPPHVHLPSGCRFVSSQINRESWRTNRTSCLVSLLWLAMLNLADDFHQTDSSTFSPLPTLWVRDLSLSSILQKFFLPFSENKGWLGQYASIIPSVSMPDMDLLDNLLIGLRIAGVLSLTFPRMQSVMTPTGACRWHLLDFPLGVRYANYPCSRFLRWTQPYRLVYGLLFCQRN